MSAHTKLITAVRFSPCNGLLASASHDRSVVLWDFASKSMIKQLFGHTQSVYCVDFSNSGEHMASGSADNSVIIWHSASLVIVKQVRFTHEVWSLKYQPNGNFLAVGLKLANISILN